ncbi:MAG: glutamyl-tRNA amidotransferase, partial [Alphaproteobacteria bacterium HGW-Alphaproteobacteria-2]
MQPGLRERLSGALKDAMKARDAARTSTLRLINAAIKDRDIAVRSEARREGVSDEEILSVLTRMVRQRQESARAYEEGGRLELAARELDEIGVIEEYLPRQMTEEEQEQAVAQAVAEIGAAGVRDMGRVMALLKQRHAGQMDFTAVSAQVKARLCGARAVSES